MAGHRRRPRRFGVGGRARFPWSRARDAVLGLRHGSEAGRLRGGSTGRRVNGFATRCLLCEDPPPRKNFQGPIEWMALVRWSHLQDQAVRLAVSDKIVLATCASFSCVCHRYFRRLEIPRRCCQKNMCEICLVGGMLHMDRGASRASLWWVPREFKELNSNGCGTGTAVQRSLARKPLSIKWLHRKTNSTHREQCDFV